MQNQGSLNKQIIEYYEEINARVARCERELFPADDFSMEESILSDPNKMGGSGGIDARINRILDERMAGGNLNIASQG